jgi:hypothetical protein
VAWAYSPPDGMSGKKQLLENSAGSGIVHHETAGQSFGSVQIDLVRPIGATEPQLILWEGSSASVATSVEYDDRSFVPLAIDASVFECLRLPAGCASYDSVEQVFREIRSAILRYSNVTEDAASLLAYFCFSTWFVDVLFSAPSIVISCPVSAEGVLLLRLLSCFCRRALVLGEISSSSIAHFPRGLMPTLLVHQCEISARMQKVLNASTYRRLAAVRNGKMMETYGAKVVASREDALLLDNFVHIALAPCPTGQRSQFDDLVERDLAARFQPVLLRFRFDNLQRVAAATFDAPELVSPVREVARSWGQCILDEGLRADIIALLRPRDEQIRAERAVDIRAIVIEVVLALCHDAAVESAYVAEITEGVNTLLQMRKETEELEPKKVGSILNRRLQLFTERLDKGGRGVVLAKVRQQVHRLAIEYGVRTVANPVQLCSYCPTTGVES